MKIIAPIDNKKELGSLIDAGADTFYGGISSEALFSEKSADNKTIVNCRPWRGCNFESFQELEKATTKIFNKGKEFYLTLNSYYYPENHIKKIIKAIKEMPLISGFIVSDIKLITELKKLNQSIILSTQAHATNKECIEFYKKLGAKRIIFPRHTKITEMQKIIKEVKEIQFEAFILNEDCFFIQGTCYYSHGIGMSPNKRSDCKSITNMQSNTFTQKELVKMMDYPKEMFTNCGLCQIPKLLKAGISGVKIVGRGRGNKQKIDDVKLVKFSLDNARLQVKEHKKKVKEKFFKLRRAQCGEKCMYKP